MYRVVHIKTAGPDKIFFALFDSLAAPSPAGCRQFGKAKSTTLLLQLISSAEALEKTDRTATLDETGLKKVPAKQLNEIDKE